MELEHLPDPTSVINANITSPPGSVLLESQLEEAYNTLTSHTGWNLNMDFYSSSAVEGIPPIRFVDNAFAAASKPSAKIRKKVSNKDIAKAIAKHTKEKAKYIDQLTSTIAGQISSEEQKLEAKKAILETTKNRMSFYDTQKKRFGKKNKDIQKEFEQAIIAVQSFDDISNITLDTKDRLIITTKSLFVQQEDWDTPKEIGICQIRIDFSQGDISDGVRVLNITQRIDDTYDSPTINDTRCCWGSIKKDVSRDFYTQNLEELVFDMIEYIRSPHVQHGYLGYEGNKDKGWEQFFHAAQQQPKDFSWEKYPEEESAYISISAIEISLESLPDVENHELESLRNYNDSLQRELDSLRMREARRMNREEHNHPQREEIFCVFRDLGLTEEAQQYYFSHLARGMEIDRLTLSSRGNFFQLTACPSNPALPQRHILLNDFDIEAQKLEALRRSHLPEESRRISPPRRYEPMSIGGMEWMSNNTTVTFGSSSYANALNQYTNEASSLQRTY